MASNDVQLRIQQLEAENSSLRRELALAKDGYSIDAITSTGEQLERVVQRVIDIGVDLIGAQFGAFFYGSVGPDGQQMTLYALSGAPRESFSRFPIPGRTALFRPTFDGEPIIRIDDVHTDPRYGLSPPHYGMPPGHLAVRSYLAAPVITLSGEVLGGLFFGHPNPGVFTARAERTIAGIAQIAAIALENANLFRAVLHSQRRFKALIENIAEGIVIVDDTATIRYVSPSVPAILGHSPAEMIGHSAMEHMHADDLPELQAFFDRVLTHPEENIATLHRRQHKDGRWLWLEGVMANLLHDPAVRGVVVNFRDVTERKSAADAQIRSQKMEALGTLAGGIAHDFNNLLLSIAGNAKLAASDLVAEHEAQRSIAEIARASRRAKDLVDSILAFSRQQPPKRDVVELTSVVEEALRLLRATIPATVQIKPTFAPDIPAIYADASQIHQVLMNLVTNAAHAIGGRVGEIEVSADGVTIEDSLSTVGELKSGRYAHVTVRDSGCGMSPETVARIFDPFFTTKPVGQGTGLGLSVVHGIVRAHGGAIVVYSELGKGTAFHIYLPSASGKEQSMEASQPAVARGQGERVLYIDDDESIVFLTRRILERLGYRVSGYSQPREGLQAFRDAPSNFDVVVTDLSMPEMSGFDLARELQAIRPDIPILLTSGYVRSEDREVAKAQGIVDVIAKPNTVDELGHSLDRVFRSVVPSA